MLTKIIKTKKNLLKNKFFFLRKDIFINMELNFSNEEVKYGKPSIFLAGPTKRDSNVNDSWRKMLGII